MFGRIAVGVSVVLAHRQITVTDRHITALTDRHDRQIIRLLCTCKEEHMGPCVEWKEGVAEAPANSEWLRNVHSELGGALGATGRWG